MTKERGKRGPDPKYRLRAVDGGAPVFSVRLNPDVYEWVKEQGGAAWVRQHIEALYEKQKRKRQP